MRIFLRKLHRWLGLLMALQIAAWMLSGFYFSLYPIEQIRGEHLTRAPEPPDRTAAADAPPPGPALLAVDRHLGADWTLTGLRLQSISGRTYWRVEGSVEDAPFVRLVDPESGAVRPKLSAGEAEARARNWLLEPGPEHDLNPRVEWVESETEGGEFRGRALPAWRVAFAGPEHLRLYLDPWTGDLLARRTDRWRVFDFLWMLHIMDFDERDDFNTPLLQVAALLGLAVALGGFLLWTVTASPPARRIRAARASLR